MALAVFLSGHDVTADAGPPTFSNVDPGGYEACSFTLPPSVAQPKPGDHVLILEGLATAWEGMVEDPGPTQSSQRAEGQVQAVGYGAKLKDNPYSMIYASRDLAAWRATSVARRLNLTSYRIGEMTVGPDTANGKPGITTGWNGAWTDKAVAESWYDAGPGNTIAACYLEWTRQPSVDYTDTNWDWDLWRSASDDTGETRIGGNLRAAGPSSNIFTFTAQRYVMLQLAYLAAGGGSDAEYSVSWRNLGLYGPHGLDRQAITDEPPGLFPADIAAHALTQTTGIAEGVVDTDPAGFIAGHVVYRDATLPEQVIDDMAKLLGWHWGVWEAPSILGSTPRLDFRARPPSATAVVSRADCDGLKISERRSQLYDRVVVTYTDAAGTPGQATVTAENPRMPADSDRTLGPLSIGISSQGAAEDYGAQALALAQSSQRGGGSPILPSMVLLPGGGTKPAHLLKAGLDRLKITDLPDSGSWTETDTRRFDTFRVKRVETSVENGNPRTRVELDEGADLLEVLNARFAIAATVAG